MKIEYNIPNYTKAEAYIIIDDFLNNLVSEHSDLVSNPSKTWNASKDKMDFGFKVMVFNTSGNIQLLEEKIVLDGKVPFLATSLSGTIEKTIRANLEKAFPKK
jgi:hypothetical protein